MFKTRGTLEERFWPKVNKTENCWLWTANKNNQGYGLIRLGGTARKVLAHRVSWEFANGPIPSNMCVLHACDTPLCVNPSHLFLGTLADNMADKESKGRSGRDEMWLKKVKELGKALKTNQEWIAKNKAAAKARRKLTEDQESEVRRLRASSEAMRSLSRIFNIDRTCIKRIINE